MDRLKKILLVSLVLICMLVTSIPLTAAGYNGYPAGALTSLDSDIRMASQRQWMDHDNYRSYKYRIVHPEFDYSDFMYEANWMVEVDGKSLDKKIMLMRPRSDGSQGRTFIQDSDLSYWGKVLNGNTSFLQREASNYKANVINAYRPSEQYSRLYIKDAARLTGAKVQGTRGLDYYDAALLQYGEVIIETTEFPTATNGLPAKGKPNTDITFKVSGKEFYPHSTYRTRPEINYKVTLDGGVIKEGKTGASSFSESITINKPPGTYQVELTVWDVVERATKVKKTIVIGDDGSVTPPDGGEIEPPPPVPERYEYELDVEVYRLDGRTVEKGTNTATDVYVERADFSDSREQAKQEFQSYIEEVNNMKSDAESKKSEYESEKSSAESEKSSAQSDLSSCLATPPDKEGNTPDCSGYESAIASAEQKIHEMTNKINQANQMIALYEQSIRKAEAELAYIQSEEAKYSVVNPTVFLDYNDSLVSQTTVSLSEGEGPKRYTMPSWTLNGDGTIMAQINEDGKYQEFYYDPLESRSEVSLGYNTRVGHDLYPSSSSNNWKDTPIYISSKETAACPPTGQYFAPSEVEGIVRTVNEDGNTRVLKEKVRSEFTKLPKEEIRAGFGFEYQLTTQYINYDNEPEPAQETGTKTVESYFPTLGNFLPYSKDPAIDKYINDSPQYKVEGYNVGMETNQSPSPRSETRTWLLPPVAVEEYSGNLFAVRNNDYKTHPERNPHDKILLQDEEGNELTRWYVDLLQPDGIYEFKVRTYGAGVNQLNTCQTGKVMVKGTIIGDENGDDDFVKRSVSPNNPFPGGIGWNWSGQDFRLTALTDWYRNWYDHPDKLPASQYDSMYFLTPEKIKEVRAFNEGMNHEYILGKSLFDSVHIPTSDK
ncbi:hypothetical protein [Bacillus sp. JJ722]|uniref:hypothetical protein n=1 Tax=Bacillus sp. JJ722 TaxID=3122973 RepID=UPI002FFDC703